MKRMTVPAVLALAFVIGVGVNDAAAQAIPNIVAEAPPVLFGPYATFRARMVGMDRVHGGALAVHYLITCAKSGESCAGVSPHRGEAVIPCGESEAGVIALDVTQPPYSALPRPYTLTLEIQRIEFGAWSQATIDRVNRDHGWNYRYRDGRLERFQEDICPTGTYSPTAVTEGGAAWSSSGLAVN